MKDPWRPRKERLAGKHIWKPRCYIPVPVQGIMYGSVTRLQLYQNHWDGAFEYVYNLVFVRFVDESASRWMGGPALVLVVRTRG